MLRVFIVAVVIGLAGCATSKYPPDESAQPIPGQTPADALSKPRPAGPLPPSTRPTYNLTGYPKATQEGYIDGCETAKRTSYAYKDENRYVSDGQYRMGWDDGFSICRGTR
ncbi:hypothetical protein [Nitrosomonas halophila]|uniref:Lipoprotein n=1 Tax=Nitrosomonas halophila TaxID=44576 RepID=A0A1H3GWX9_9PROT|nr:hypothetical protein [Nitrosomonas halophila]SDY07138.1 hypothetical protein SAMN05421881_10174 [Nitrosomonas halophila]